MSRTGPQRPGQGEDGSGKIEPGRTAPPPKVPAPARGRLKRAAFALLLGFSLAVLIAVLSGEGAAAPGGRLGGDLPAFITAGRIAAEGEWQSLYDAEVQHDVQKDLWNQEDKYLPFVYPPFVAAAYRPLAALDYRTAYLLHTLLMALALLAAVVLARPVFPWISELPLSVTFAGVLAFLPNLSAVLGGQNTAFTLLLFATVLRFEFEKRSVTAGIAAALLLYKPQYGIPLACLLVVGRRWRMLAGWTLTAGALYAAGTAVLGPEWPFVWWSQATVFAPLNAVENAKNFISIPGFSWQIFGPEAGTIALAITGLVVGGGAAHVWWLTSGAPALRISVVITALIAAAPQVQYYDAGILFLPVAVLASQKGTSTWLFLTVAWLAGLLHLGAGLFGASPLVLLVLGIAILMSQRAIRTFRAAGSAPS